MWIHFQYKSELDPKRFVIRPFVGGVNGISGEASAGNMGSILRRQNAPTQDYIVLPEQRWLDGIATRPGIVKQFVATVMAPPHRGQPGELSRGTGSVKLHGKSPGDDTDEEAQEHIGASIEWQVTGRDEVGGLQLQIIPTFDVERMCASSVKNYTGSEFNRPQGARKFDVLKTPEEEGLLAGDMMHVKDMKHVAQSRVKLLGDLLSEAPMELTAQDVVELKADRDGVTQRILNVGLYDMPDTTVTFSVSSINRKSTCVRRIRLITTVSSSTKMMPGTKSWLLFRRRCSQRVGFALYRLQRMVCEVWHH